VTFEDVKSGALLVASVWCLSAAWTLPPTGCSPRTPAQTAADVALDAAYAAELQGCLEKGKAAHSRAVYRACADSVDARWSADGGVR
jgi:hypothetical protein